MTVNPMQTTAIFGVKRGVRRDGVDVGSMLTFLTGAPLTQVVGREERFAVPPAPPLKRFHAIPSPAMVTQYRDIRIPEGLCLHGLEQEVLQPVRMG